MGLAWSRYMGFFFCTYQVASSTMEMGVVNIQFYLLRSRQAYHTYNTNLDTNVLYCCFFYPRSQNQQ
jgi:hypothetical protein